MEVTGEKPVRWRTLWPIPVGAIALVLLGAGIFTALATRPKADIGAMIRAAERLDAEGEHEQALVALNQKILSHVRTARATDQQRADFFTLRARVLYNGQAALPVTDERNHAAIIADYQRAETLGADLAEQDLDFLVRTKIAKDEINDALRRTRDIDNDQQDLRHALMRRLIRWHLDRLPDGRQQTLDILDEFNTDTSISPDDRLWVAARMGELRIKLGEAQEAVIPLVREITRAQGRKSPEVGELNLVLGEAYSKIGEHDNALDRLADAEQLFPPDDARVARIRLVRGRVLLADGQLERAREDFRLALDDPPIDPELTEIIIGAAEANAGLAFVSEDETYDDLALERYGEAIRRANSTAKQLRPAIVASLMQRFANRFTAGKAKSSLRYVQLADGLFAESEVPAEVLEAIGITQRRIVDEIVTEQNERAESKDADRKTVLANLEPVTKRDVQRRLLDAGDHLMQHAGRVAADHDKYLESLWLAALSYDEAGHHTEAQRAYEQYRGDSSSQGSHRSEATFRLAQVLHAQQRYRAAAELYDELLSARFDPDPQKEVGPWADLSVVPLAQCLLRDADDSNDLVAQGHLQNVINGDYFAPDAREYRDALLELAVYNGDQSEHVDAISYLDQFVTQYPEDERALMVRYRLADAYRLRAIDLRDEVASREMPPVEARMRREESITSMDEARILYTQVKDELQRRDPASLEEYETEYLRNASLMVGDCAFELGVWRAAQNANQETVNELLESAISAYDEAAETYVGEPASLIAKVQIVSVYIALERWGAARAAHERASQHFKALSDRYGDSVWEDPTLPMGKRHWERWLAATRLMEQHASHP